MVNIGEYELLSIETGVFKDIELDLLKETLKVWKEKPGQPYDLLEIRDGRALAGFCLFYRSPETDYTFDIHTFVVGSGYKNSAVGASLLDSVMKNIGGVVSRGVLRIETSRNKENMVAEGFFSAHGFQLIGHIPDFYQSDNDYYIYMRQITQAEGESVSGDKPDLFLPGGHTRSLSA